MFSWDLFIFSLIQGVTEFLPVSSSGHLILLSFIARLDDQDSILKMSAHAGTLAATILYFRSDLAHMVKGFLPSTFRDQSSWRYLAIKLILASVPSILFGMYLGSRDTSQLYTLSVVGWNSIVYGTLLYAADVLSLRTRSLRSVTYLESLLIGLSQAISLVPGTSRSGVCMTAGRLLCLSREDSIKFSFMLSIPTTLAATLYTFYCGCTSENTIGSCFEHLLAGGFFSFVVGVCVIYILMRWMSVLSFKLLAFYRLSFGITLVVLNN